MAKAVNVLSIGLREMKNNRDFIGYGLHRPSVEWPNDARIAISIVVNYQEGSEYSLLDGFSKLNDMAETPAKLGQPAIALTDHGVVHGAVDFYKFANLSGVKPIIGMEGYVTDGSRVEKKSGSIDSTYHLTSTKFQWVPKPS